MSWITTRWTRPTRLAAGLSLCLSLAAPAASAGWDVRTIHTIDGSASKELSATDGDIFGFAVATGDFDCDRRPDLVVAAPGASVDGRTQAGLAVAFYSGPTEGLSELDARGGIDVLAQTAGRATLNGSPVPSARLGWDIVAGDMDGDGCDDLAVGIPFADIDGEVDAGAVQLVYGHRGGLTRFGARTLTENDPRIAGHSEVGDAFGQSLAMGDFDYDGRADLAIGVPGESLGRHDGAGTVQIVYGGKRGARLKSRLFRQGDTDMGGAPERGDAFGSALATGDIDGDTFDDLIVGVPGQDLRGVRDAGAVHIVRGGPRGLDAGRSEGHRTVDGDVIWTLRDVSFGAQPRSGQRFGASVAAGDFDGNGIEAVVIATQGAGLMDRDTLHLVRADLRRGTVEGEELASGLVESGEARALRTHQRGRSLLTEDLDHDGRDDLVVISALAYITWKGGDRSYQAGFTELWQGSPAGLRFRSTWTGLTAYDYASAERQMRAHWGAALASADFDGDGRDDIVVGIPAGPGAGHGNVEVRHMSY